MELLNKLLKNTIKYSLIMAIVIGTYLSFQGYVKYPFTQNVGPQQETKTIYQEKAEATNQSVAPKQEVKIPEASKTPILLDPSPKILPIVSKPDNKQEVIVLGKKNTILFRGVVNMLSVAKIQNEALRMSLKLPPSTPIYLVLDTPGGSVEAGNILIDTLRALPNKVHTINLFSASMGFHIAESLDDRLILPSGTLMSHRMSVGGISGQVPGEAVTSINYALRLAERMDKQASKRLGMSFNDYRALIQNEVWLDGQDAVDAHFADREVLAICGSDLQGTYKEDINLIFFVITATWSDCPLIRFPVAVEMKDLGRSSSVFGPQLAEAKKAQYEEFIHDLLYSREKFVHKYIVTEKYKEFIPQ